MTFAVEVAMIFAVCGSELSGQRISLACVNLFCCICGGIYVVTRDNYHCCCVYAGELALNSLVP